MLLLFLARAASASCPTGTIIDYYGPYNVLVWPNGFRRAPTDTVLVLRRDGVGEIGDLVVRDPGGVEVPVTRIDPPSLDGVDWAVLVPLSPLVPGDGYQVESGDGYLSSAFDVRDSVADVGTPPIPVTRSIDSEVTFQYWDCPEEAVYRTAVDYRLCNPPVVTLLAIGDTEPPVPSLADPGDVVFAAGDLLSLDVGLTPNLATTAWIGGFDAAGRFVGWTPDPLVMPSVGTRTVERADGAAGGGGTTPTAFSSCPESAVWETKRTQTCALWSPATDECLEEPPAESGGGCDTAAAPVGAMSILLVGLIRRRREARC
jgi:hypothetical protein